MKTLIILRILYLDADEGILVLLEDNGSLPTIEVSGKLSSLVLEKLQTLLVSRHEELWNSKVFSSIDSNSEFVEICFNIFLPNKNLSKKTLVRYNKNSIDLQRFINHNRS